MTGPMDRADAALADWLREGPESGPIDGLEAILAGTRSVSQRPAWTFPSRWLPAALGGGPGIRPLPVAILLVLTSSPARAAGPKHRRGSRSPSSRGRSRCCWR